jgi:putative Mn2+ efflux pump MntP
MNFLFLFLVAIGLGMDAFAVAVAVGAVIKRLRLRHIFRLSLHFGLFQFLMPIVGWLAGMTMTKIFADYDHWIAFVILVCVGGKMIWESFKEDRVALKDPTRGLSLIILSLATSIDALAVGLSFAFLKMPIIYPSAVIGIVAFIMTAGGMVLGTKIGKLFGKRVKLLGGLILIGIGVKILLDHIL